MPEYTNIYNKNDFLNRTTNYYLRILCNIRIRDYIEGMETWDMSRCTNMRNMFENCKNIPDISGWDTSACEDMSYMFKNCSHIPDISSWNISSCINMNDMFRKN